MSVVLSVVLARKQTQPRVVLSIARLLAPCRVALIMALTVGRFHSFTQDSALAFGGGRHSRFPRAVLGLLAPRPAAAPARDGAHDGALGHEGEHVCILSKVRRALEQPKGGAAAEHVAQVGVAGDQHPAVVGDWKAATAAAAATITAAATAAFASASDSASASASAAAAAAAAAAHRRRCRCLGAGRATPRRPFEGGESAHE
jgi:hypothetical protein